MVSELDAAAMYMARYLKESIGLDFLKVNLFDQFSWEYW
jgi:hypothetical protein